MRAAILAIGSELLGTDRLDTNSLRLTEALHRYGVDVAFKAVIGDELETLAAEVGRLVGRFELLLLTGGLGPTEDDLTREAVARALGRELERRPEIVSDIEAKFSRFGMRMPQVNRKQADVIVGSRWIANDRGTAPGLELDSDGTTLFLFPGVPSELDGMVESDLLPWLEQRRGHSRTGTAVLKLACLPESTVEERLAPFYERLGREGFSVLARPGEVTLLLTRAGGEEERKQWIRERVDFLRQVFESSVFTERADGTLEGSVGGLLRSSGTTLVTAESCTGGLLGERLTRLPGSSDYFLGAAVTYSDRLKTVLLGVSEERIAGHGAVSEPVARDMATGARRVLGADWALGVSGIAGPGGGSDEKPVGTVHLALAGPTDGEVSHRRLALPGNRERVRWLSSQWALDMLRRRLLRVAPERHR